MRNFILGSAAITSGAVSAAPSAADEGKVGLAYMNNGVMTFDGGSNIKDKGYIVLLRTLAHGGNVVLPFYKHHFKYVKGVYQAATTYASSVEIASVTAGETYTLIAVKKGVKFNERNRWTATVKAKTSDTAATISQKLADYFNANPALGLTVEYDSEEGTLSFTAQNAGEDYEIVPADDLMGLEVTTTAHGIPAYGDAAYVKDLADKAAADAGFEYTYREDNALMYPNYPLNPLKASDSEDNGFTIYTLNFSERREVKTRDEVVNQIVQIAFNSASFTGLDSVLAALV